ncbi:MAG: hypothetical protein SFZ03_05475 [Candidatus Melainabacteria bacterium]|nr:hypothetical protein [Candidatus Melainabacteria bacterium]
MQTPQPVSPRSNSAPAEIEKPPSNAALLPAHLLPQLNDWLARLPRCQSQEAIRSVVKQRQQA